MTSDASDTGELPPIEDQLLQAINILKLCGKMGETSLEPEEFDLDYPLWAVVSLLEEVSDEIAWEGGKSKIIQAETIVKACAVTHATTGDAVGENGFQVSWALDVAIDLMGEVIAERVKQGRGRRPGKRAMREVSTVDPDHARQFHRLLNAAGKLPLAELERLARYAEIELADGKPKREARASAPKATGPIEGATDSAN